MNKFLCEFYLSLSFVKSDWRLFASPFRFHVLASLNFLFSLTKSCHAFLRPVLFNSLASVNQIQFNNNFAATPSQ